MIESDRKPGWRLWLLVMLLAGGVLAARLVGGVAVQTDIRQLLPSTGQPKPVAKLLAVQQQQYLAQTAMLLGAADTAALRRGYDAALASLQTDPVHELAPAASRVAALPSVWVEHRHFLLGDRDRQALQNDSAEQWVQRALQRIYGLSGTVSATNFQDDPFGLLAGFAESRPAPSAFVPGGHCLQRHVDGKQWCLLLLQSRLADLGLAANAAQVASLDAITAAARAQAPGLEIVDAGVSRHALLAAQRAKSEMSLISLGSLAGVFLLLWCMLRRPQPFLLTLVALASGATLGLALCLLAFKELHLISLVFGACLIGIAVDYTLHYFCATGTGVQRVQQIRVGMRTGMFTTVLAFLGLLLSPYASLHQVAVLACGGLLGAWLSVRFLFSALPASWSGQLSPALLATAARCSAVSVQTRPFLLLVLTATVLLAALGSVRIQAEEDLRAMYYSDPHLLAREQRARSLIGGLDAAQLMVLQAPTIEVLLQAQEALSQRLDQAVVRGELRRYFALSQSLPSLQQQASDHQLMQAKLMAPGAALEQLAAQLQLPEHWVSERRQQFADAQPLTPQRWRQSPAAQPYLGLLQEFDGGWAALVRMGGVREAAALQQLAAAPAAVDVRLRWVDPIADAERALGQARRTAVSVLLLTAVAVLLILALRYGLRPALWLMLPTALAILVPLGVLGWLGAAFSLFRLFALLLVIGLAIDYAVFLRESAGHPASSLLAVAASTGTTLLAFGLLMFSSTPALQQFGGTVIWGVLTAFVSSLLLQRAGLFR